MTDFLSQLPDVVRHKAEALGQVGLSWLAGLDGLVSELCAAWNLTLGHVMTGGTAGLGPQLSELGLSVDAQIEAMCATLKEAWRAPPDGGGFMDGAEKARSLAEFIGATWRELGQPCSARVIYMATEFAQERCRAFDPTTAVLAHGDAHAWNALLVPGSEPSRFKFVDPDGLFIERAYDLGVLMRAARVR